MVKKISVKFIVYYLITCITFTSVFYSSKKEVYAIDPATIAIIVKVITCLCGVITTGVTVYNAFKDTEEDLHNDEEVNNFISQNMSINEEGKYVISPKLTNTINNVTQKIVEDHGYIYVFSDRPSLPESFASLQEYNNYIDLIKENNIVGQNDTKYDGSSSYRNNIYSLPEDLNFILRQEYTGKGQVTAYIIDSEWNTTFPTETLNTGASWEIKNTTTFSLKLDSDYSLTWFNRINNAYILTTIEPEQFLVWRTLNDFKNYTGGILPYYTNDNYDPDNKPEGEQVIDKNIIDNSITYGDVVDYVTTNNITNHNEVYNYINNYESSGGGGSGSGGSGDDSGGINLDWLGSLGKLIASIINGIGNMINELLTGIIDTVTKIVDNLSKLLSGVANIIPESFTALINAVFSWLPEELRVLIVSSVTLMILVGIIKLIRGS